MPVTVLIAGVEKFTLLALHESEQKLQDHGANKSDERRLKLRRQARGDGLKSLPDRADVTVGPQGDAKRADRGAQPDDRADEAQDRNRPQEAMHETVTRGNVLLIVIRLVAKDGRNVADLADVLEVRECPLDAIEQQKVAGVIDQRMNPAEHRTRGLAIEEKIGLLRHGGKSQGFGL